MNAITADILKEIMGRVGTNAEDMATELKRISSIQKQKFELQQKRYRAKSDYEAVLKCIAEEEKHLRENCPHYSTNFHEDPSGGRDSFTQCSHCGKQW